MASLGPSCLRLSSNITSHSEICVTKWLFVDVLSSFCRFWSFFLKIAFGVGRHLNESARAVQIPKDGATQRPVVERLGCSRSVVA